MLAAPVFGEVPETVLAEHDLQKRSDLALQEADEQISAASKAYSPSGGLKDFENAPSRRWRTCANQLEVTAGSGQACTQATEIFQAGRTEVAYLVARLDTLEKEVLVDDRPPVARTKNLLTEVHEKILQDIMSKK